ncbi:MAG: hypothetical protein V5A62_03385 [Haloarculaceae archaeon]
MSLLTPERLADLREGPLADRLTFAAFAVGVVLGSLHPAGLVAGGLLVGLVAPTLRRALLFGLYLGGLVLLVFGVSLLLAGTLGRVAAMGGLTLLSVVVGLAFPTLGALGVRGVV